MKLTLEPTEPLGPHRNSKVIIETDHDGHTFEQVLEKLIVPALLAWGFPQAVIDDYLAE